MSPRLEVLSGPELDAAIAPLAALRITVFRAWPYLYDGSEAYEAKYLAEFAATPGAVIVGAFSGDTLVGAATASPLAGQSSGFLGPIEAAGIDASELFYFGESVLLPDYRGKGLGHAFFDAREQAARAAGAAGSMFAAVVRPDDHPARPADYRPLDGFWRARGYAPVPGLVTQIAWQDVGDTAESAKPM